VQEIAEEVRKVGPNGDFKAQSDGVFRHPARTGLQDSKLA
jgi:hypothetical protein